MHFSFHVLLTSSVFCALIIIKTLTDTFNIFQKHINVLLENWLNKQKNMHN